MRHDATAIVVVDDDPLILESLAVMLAGERRTVYLCRDIEAATVVLGRVQASHVIADVQYSGRFAFEGLTFVGAIKARQPECRIVLMSGYDSEVLRTEAMSRGADGFMAKPFFLEELEAKLELDLSCGDVECAEIVRFPSIAEIVGGPQLYAHVQPIVDLRDMSGGPLGFEALARYAHGPLPGNGWIFEYARLRGRSFELNAACVRRALAAAAELPEWARIFINVDPGVLSDARDLTKTILGGDIDPQRIVVELTEEMPMDGAPEALAAIDRLRAAGVQFALDDFGTGYAHLGYAAAIRPAFLKVGQNLGSSFECDDTRRRIINGISVLAKALGCLLIVEGVETEATATAVREAGIPLAQGYFFGVPDAAEAYTLNNCCFGSRSFSVPLTVA